MWMLFGFIGSFLVLLAWVLGLIDEMESKKNLIELKFSFVALTGVMFLFAYALSNRHWPFIILNGGILALVTFEVLYSIKIER